MSWQPLVFSSIQTNKRTVASNLFIKCELNNPHCVKTGSQTKMAALCQRSTGKQDMAVQCINTLLLEQTMQSWFAINYQSLRKSSSLKIQACLCVNAAIVTWLFAQLQRGYQNSTAHVMKQIKTPYTANERILHNASRYSFCSLCEHYVWERFALNFHPKPACRTPKNALNFWSHRITTIVHMLFNCV